MVYFYLFEGLWIHNVLSEKKERPTPKLQPQLAKLPKTLTCPLQSIGCRHSERMLTVNNSQWPAYSSCVRAARNEFAAKMYTMLLQAIYCSSLMVCAKRVPKAILVLSTNPSKKLGPGMRGPNAAPLLQHFNSILDAWQRATRAKVDQAEKT